MDNFVIDQNDMIWKIINLFDISNLHTVNIDNERVWVLPVKDATETVTGVEYGDRISESLRKAIEDSDGYDVTYIKNIFKKIDRCLYKGIPFEVLSRGGGFSFPNVPYSDKLQGYNQLHTKQSCDDFISEVINFKSIPQRRDRLKIFYLLGYVGSGKSTFINYILNSKSDDLISKSIIQVHFEYDDIRENIYNEKTDQMNWDIEIWDLLLKKARSSFEDPNFIRLDLEENEKEEDGEGDEELLKKILVRYNVLIVFDGLDSLSPNKIEKNNNMCILVAISRCLKKLRGLYANHSRIRKTCHVVFSLRKCTYDMPGMPRIGRRDEDDAYFLPAPNFNSVIEKILIFLSEDKLFLKNNKEQIIDIINAASVKIEHIAGGIFNKNTVDIFDNNYRRRLRYISSLIIVTAMRVSNTISKQSNSKIHEAFFSKLCEEIKNLKDHIAYDILVSGVNTGFNNHFSNYEDEDNLGSLCGFVDNIFCYFPFEMEQNNEGIINIKMIIKLRALQILNTKKKITIMNLNIYHLMI